MTTEMTHGFWRPPTEIVDLTMDGYSDLVASSGQVQVCYETTTPGVYSILHHAPYSSSAYHLSAGDLNNDGRPDLLTSDDGSDRVAYNVGTDAFGRAVYSTVIFQFLAGGDDGIGGNNLVADLDGDGWRDALIADVDVTLAGCGRRLHIYHNPGGTPGATIQLREEREQASGGWLGVGGMQAEDLTGTYDVAVFDINRDGFQDLVVGRCLGTHVWIQDPPLGVDGPGTSASVGGAVTIR